MQVPKWTVFVIAAGLMAGACHRSETQIERAERRARTIAKLGSPAELCEAKKEVTEAYLEAGNNEEYLAARIHEQAACLNAR